MEWPTTCSGVCGNMECGTETLDLRSSSSSRPPQKKYRILLDRSACSGPQFQKLKMALLTTVPRFGEVLVTPMLLAETLGLWHSNPRSPEAGEHLRFILEIGSGRWFEDPFSIFKMELCAHTLPDRHYLLPKPSQDIWEQNIRAVIAGGAARPGMLQRVNAGVQKERERAAKLRKIGVKIRNEVARQFRTINPGKKLSDVDVKEAWASMLQTQLNRFGEGLIVRKRLYQAGRKSDALRTWGNTKDRCPYFTNWVKGLLYTQFYAAYYSNSKIDEHSQADIQHLIYLEHADVLVSEEKAFMRQAFMDLYQESGKQYWTLDELECAARA